MFLATLDEILEKIQYLSFSFGHNFILFPAARLLRIMDSQILIVGIIAHDFDSFWKACN